MREKSFARGRSIPTKLHPASPTVEKAVLVKSHRPTSLLPVAEASTDTVISHIFVVGIDQLESVRTRDVKVSVNATVRHISCKQSFGFYFNSLLTV